MTKYFIVNRNNQWLKSPMYWDMNPGVTTDPFQAWTFEKKKRTELEHMGDFMRNVERKLFFGKDTKDKVPTEADDIVEFLNQGKDLKEYSTQEQEFQDHNGLLSHYSYSRSGDMPNVIRQQTGLAMLEYDRNNSQSGGMNVTFVHHPVFDGPLTNYL